VLSRQLLLVIAATTLLTDQGAPAAGGSHVAHLGTVKDTPRDPAVGQEIADATPTIARAPFGEGEVEITVLPARAGMVNELTIRFTDSSGAQEFVEGPVSVAVKVPGSDLAPLTRTAEPGEDGTWKVSLSDFGYAGAWDVGVTARVGALTTNEGTVTIPVKPASSSMNPDGTAQSSTGGRR
jgi:hypothetical protein